MESYLAETNKQINIPYLLKIGTGKVLKIGRYLSDKSMNKIALFLGNGVEELVGDKLFQGINKYKIEILHKQIVDNIKVEDITLTAFNLSPQVSAIVGIGGGKALDFAKYSAYLLKIPFISVPTAMSNDGFCSPTSSLTVSRKRKSVKSNIPYGVVIDLDIINSNPESFLYSGIGDMASKITALWDWKTANLKGFERFNDFSSLLAYNSLDLLFLKHSSDIHDVNFQRSLANSLLTSGISMEIAGSSRPASGSEHLISHALDEISETPKMHGIQVGVSAYLCALLQENPNIDELKSILVSTGFFDFVKKDPFNKKEYMKALELAPAIKQDYYTILSEKDYLAKAEQFINNDELLKQVIVG